MGRRGKVEYTGLDMERLRYTTLDIEGLRYIMLDMEGLMLYGCKKTRRIHEYFLQAA